MGKVKKSTVKFLKATSKSKQKSVSNGKGSDAKPKSKGRSRPKKDKSSEMESDEMEVDNVIKVNDSGSIRRHQDELSSLHATDPEFFKYLQDNDAGLLEFGDDESNEDPETDEIDVNLDEDIDGGDDDSNAEQDTDVAEEALHSSVSIEVTKKLIIDTIKKATSKEGSIVALKQLLSMFRAACIPTVTKAGNEEEDVASSRYSISTPEIYECVMIRVIESAHIAFYRVLKIDPSSKSALAQLENCPKWRQMQLLVLSFFKSILHTLASLAESAQQGQVSVFLISSLENYIPLLSPLPRLAKGVLKVLLSLWSMGLAPSEDACNVRAHAFLRIRQMAVHMPGAMAEECFRAIYLSYARVSKSFSDLTGPSVIFMAQCVTELYRCDVAQSYQQAFLYVRQLALHLRAAMLKKTAEAVRQIVNWQFLNCIRLWTRVICSMPSQEELGALAFPLSQVMLGVMTLAPSIYYLPLRFHLVTCMQQLSVACHMFIPTVSRLLEVLEHPDISAKLTPSTEVPPKLQHIVRFPADSVNRAAVRDLIVQETLTLLRQDAELYRYHVALPEYSFLTIKKLRTFAKKTKVAKWRDIVRTLVGQMEQNSTFAKQQRVVLGKSPSAIVDFEPLLPTGAPTASARLAKLLTGRGLNATTTVVVPNGATASANDSAAAAPSLAASTISSKAAKKADKSLNKNNKKKSKADEEENDNEEIDDIDNDDDDEEAEVEDASAPDRVHSLDWSDDEEA